jgi:DNA-binding IclR family transcriptional regulator
MITDITPTDVLAAIKAGADTVFDIAARLGVPHTSATLRHLLHDMVRDGVLVADDSDAITELRAEFAEAHADGASSNDIVQLLDDWLVKHGQPTVLYG